MKSIFKYLFITLLLVMNSCKDEPKNKDASSSEIQNETSEIMAPKIKGEPVDYATETTELKGYLAYNENSTEKRPGILIVHEWWGHNDYVRKRADMLAELGYTAFALDMYGDGKLAEHPDDAGKFARKVFQDLPEAKARFNAAMQELRKHETVDDSQISAIGYCFGGSVVLTMANTGADLDAVAAFHSGVTLPVMPQESLKARVLVCNGADDPFISAESVENFKSAMDAINAKYDYIAYPNATHGFTSKEADANAEKFDLPLAYNKEADEKSWNQLLELLRTTY